MTNVELTLVAAGFFFLVLNFAVLASLYKKCGPNEALIVSGALVQEDGKLGFKVVQRGGTVVLPLLQKLDRISLEIYPVAVKTRTPFTTVSGAPVFISGVAQIKVIGDEAGIAKAAEHFLSKDPTAMIEVACDRLVHHMRAVVALMEAEELRQGPDAFAHKVHLACLPDLSKVGLMMVSFSIEDIRTDSGQYKQPENKQST